MNHFLDIGANTGQTFDEFLSKDPKYDGWTVWCFEPSPRHLPELMKTAERYRDRYHINICPFGVWSNDGYGLFRQKDDPRGDSFFPELATDHVVNNLDTGYQMIVPQSGIGAILRNYPDDDIVVVKLDCEGAEYPILEALLKSPELRKVNELYVEFHNVGQPEGTAQGLIDAFANLCPIKPWTL